MNDTTAAVPPLVTVNLYLRTQHVEYLEFLAERWETSVSQAFQMIIEKKSSVPIAERARPSQKIRKHLTITKAKLESLDRAAGRGGLERSDAARRLIDEALAKDPNI
jgi:hypothetical protein